MAITKVLAYIANVGPHMYGLETDDKPTEGINIGERLYETDSRFMYEWTGSAWVLSPGFGIINDSQIDAFGRRRVSSPQAEWTSEFQYNIHPLFFDKVTAINGTVTHLPNVSSASLTVTNENGSSAKMVSVEYHRYQPGDSQGIDMTFVFPSLENATLRFVRRSKATGSVVDDKVAKGSWDQDNFDGDGPSGVTLVETNGQIVHFDLSWLSMGQLRGGFTIGGTQHMAHHFHTGNESTDPSMSTANLPICWEIIRGASKTTCRVGYYDAENGFFLEWEGDAQAATMRAICSTVYSEGGADKAHQLGHTFAIGNEQTLRTGIGTTLVPIASIRPALTINSIVNRMGFFLENVEVFANDAMYWVLLYATSLTSASWQDPQTHSGTEFDISATAVSGGVKIAGGFIAASNKGGISGSEIKNKYPFALNSAGDDQSRSLTLAVATTGGTNKSAAGIFNVEEIR